MVKISTTQGILAGAIIALVLSCGFYALVYFTVVRAQDELISTRLESARIALEQENRDSVDAIVKNTQTIREELLNYLLPSEDPIQFLDLVEQSAQWANIYMEVKSLNKEEQSTKTGKPDPEPKHARVKLVILVEGSWSDIYHFLSLLETMPYSVSVDRVTVEEIELENGFGWGGQVHLNVDAKT